MKIKKVGRKILQKTVYKQDFLCYNKYSGILRCVRNNVKKLFS